ncbi:hypothetical protein EYF80_036504 [Liparis tanakae]|uniref:Uncharacterized protein n=1 Tax=Liparis tanakae TaxID=230148 RepID=A0A4Z2GJ04_9TELE|nr:hypothetical protein EYF80_036504 [Liparis tanakae]
MPLEGRLLPLRDEWTSGGRNTPSPLSDREKYPIPESTRHSGNTAAGDGSDSTVWTHSHILNGMHETLSYSAPREQETKKQLKPAEHVLLSQKELLYSPNTGNVTGEGLQNGDA